MSHGGHIAPRSLYVTIFLALLVLTAVTVWVSTIDLGVLNTVVALTIAMTKALLVLLFFMHLRYSTHLTWLAVSTGFVWLLVMIVFTMSDYGVR